MPLSANTALWTPGVELFLSLCRTRSFSVTARESGLSQPSVSRSLQALETALGLPLIRRDVRPIKPTSEGEQLQRFLLDERARCACTLLRLTSGLSEYGLRIGLNDEDCALFGEALFAGERRRSIIVRDDERLAQLWNDGQLDCLLAPAQALPAVPAAATHALPGDARLLVHALGRCDATLPFLLSESESASFASLLDAPVSAVDDAELRLRLTLSGKGRCLMTRSAFARLDRARSAELACRPAPTGVGELKRVWLAKRHVAGETFEPLVRTCEAILHATTSKTTKGA